MSMAALGGYAINGSNKYWPVTVDFGNGYKHDRNVPIWTLTVHEPACRFAKSPAIQAYFGDSGLRRLAENGFDAPATQYVNAVWQGCKVCGTVNLDARALGREAIEADQRAAAVRRELDRERSAKSSAMAERNTAVREAMNAWHAQHADEVAAVKEQAAADWAAKNPEQAMLLLAAVEVSA